MSIGMGNMMNWMLLACILVLVFSFVWPLLGIQGYGSWLLLGLIFLVCLLPMLLMNRKKNNRKENDMP